MPEGHGGYRRPGHRSLTFSLFPRNTIGHRTPWQRGKEGNGWRREGPERRDGPEGPREGGPEGPEEAAQAHQGRSRRHADHRRRRRHHPQPSDGDAQGAVRRATCRSSPAPPPPRPRRSGTTTASTSASPTATTTATCRSRARRRWCGTRSGSSSSGRAASRTGSRTGRRIRISHSCAFAWTARTTGTPRAAAMVHLGGLVKSPLGGDPTVENRKSETPGVVVGSTTGAGAQG